MRSLCSFTPALLLLGALTGCVGYHARELQPAETQAAFEGRSLQDGGLQRFLADHGQPVAGEWDLTRLTLVAFHFSPELDVARARLAEAEAEARTAEARPNPTFTFTPGYNQDALGGVTPWILGYALDVPLELAGKRTYRAAEGRHKVEAARFALARVAWTTRSAVRRALVELQAGEATAELLRGQKPMLAQAAQLVDAQVRAGEVSPLQAAQARIAFNRAELAVRESERAVATARSHLAEALGVPLTALGGIRLSQSAAPAPAPAATAEARAWAARNRADLLAALANYAAAESALQLEVARQYPDLSFGPGYQLDQGEGKWSIGLGFTLPVFNRNQGPIAAALARREVAAAEFRALQDRVLAEVDRAESDYLSARGDLETVEAMRSSLARQARTLREQQSVGETSRLDLARAQIELADNARAELEARVRAEQALGALEDAVQRPLALPESSWRTAVRSAGN